MNQASFIQRSAAWLIDQAILLIIYWLVVFVFGLLTGLYDDSKPSASNVLLSLGVSMFMLILIFGHFLYFGYFWSRRERSIGMGVMNIRVVKTDQRLLSFLAAGLRGSLGYYVSSLVFGLGYLWFFIDKQQKTWHDKIFDTTVLRG